MRSVSFPSSSRHTRNKPSTHAVPSGWVFGISWRTGTPGSLPSPPLALTIEMKETSRWPFPSSTWQWQYFPLNVLHAPRAWVTWAGPCEHPVGEAVRPPARLRAAPSSSWSFGPCREGPGGRAPPRGSEEPGARNQEPGTQRPDPVHGPSRARQRES